MQRAIDQIAHRLLKQESPIQLGAVGYFELTYRSARIQQHGTLIQPPRHVWILHEGVATIAVSDAIVLDEPLEKALKDGFARNLSFEVPGLGMCYQQEGGFELLPGTAKHQLIKADFGLTAMNVKKIGVDERSASNRQMVPKKSKVWWLQVAAALLTILLANILTISFLSDDGKLNIRQVAELNPFDSLIDKEEFTFEDSSEAVISSEPVAVGTDNARLDSAEAIASEKYQMRRLEMDDDTVAGGKSKEAAEIAPIVHTKTAPILGQPVYVVVGAFASEENANNLKRELEQKGWLCVLQKPEKGKLTRVMVHNDPMNTPDSGLLTKAQLEINPHSWILAE